MQVVNYLNKKSLQWKRRGSEGIMNCPFCSNPPDKEKKFSINLTSGAWQCFHLNNCGEKGSFYDFQKKLGDKPIPAAKKDMFVQQPKKKNYAKLKIKVEEPTDAVTKYLHSRGFTDATIKHFRIGSQNGDTIIFPYYRGEELVHVKYRSIKEKKFWASKDTELILFNRDNIERDDLIIAEGCFDAAALHQYGIEAVSVPNGAASRDWVDSEWDYLETFKMIYICFDSDPAGVQGARDLAIRLGEWRCKSVTFPFKDANECLMNSVNSDTMKGCFLNAADFSPETLVSPLYFEEKIQELFAQGKEMFGTKTPWKQVDSILKGWRDGELTVWSGKSGAGKSTILNQVFIDLGEKGVKSCIYSGEMSPERYLRWAVIQYQENDAPHPAKIHTALEWMSNKIYILNITSGIEPEKLLSDFEFAARRYGVKHFIIDSLMKIHFSAQDEYRQQHDFINKVVGFAQKHKVHIHLVAHPRKTERDDDQPGKVDVKGTSHITDLADNVIVLHRTSQDTKDKIAKKNADPKTKEKSISSDMLFCIKKNREFGIEGNVTMLFNEQTKKFRGMVPGKEDSKPEARGNEI